MTPRVAGLAGVVLVGGRSLRMGRDKARIRVGSSELWRRQVRVLRDSGASPVLLALRPRQRSFGNPGGEVRDAVPGSGPLGGLTSALRNCRGTHLAVLAVDMPGIGAQWFRRLLRFSRTGVGAALAGPNGYEPLAAIYPLEALQVCESFLAGGRFSLQEVVGELVRRRAMRRLPARASDLARLENWNRPSDIALPSACGIRAGL